MLMTAQHLNRKAPELFFALVFIRFDFYSIKVSFLNFNAFFLYTTGTGSTSWCYNINKMSLNSIKKIVKLCKSKLELIFT